MNRPPGHLHHLRSLPLLLQLLRLSQRVEQPDLLLPLLVLLGQERRLPGPGTGHGGRGEGEEGGFPDGEGLGLGGLGVTELELEGGAREEVGDARAADDDGAAVGLGGEDAVGDGLIIAGTGVGGA